jgi:uncharacterized membrane protein
MATVIDSVRVRAPVEEVFNFVFDWHNVAGFYEGVEGFEPACEDPWGNGARFACTVNAPMVGARQLVLEVGDFVENHGWTRFSVEGPEWVEHWWFEALPGYPRETKVNYDLKYKLPVPVIGAMVDALVTKKRRTAQTQDTLRNIKRMMEGGIGPVSA